MEVFVLARVINCLGEILVTEDVPNAKRFPSSRPSCDFLKSNVLVLVSQLLSVCKRFDSVFNVS